MLTDRYVKGIPADSSAAKARFLSESAPRDDKLDRVRGLNRIGQSLAQMAFSSDELNAIDEFAAE